LIGNSSGASNGAGRVNFGQQDFTYTPPTDYLALSTANLPDPAIDPAQGSSPEDYFGISLYTGNQGTNVSVSDLSFQPDLVWGKNRSGISNHWLFDAVRGTTKMIASDITSAEETQSGITSFNSDGFTLGTWIGSSKTNDSYVAWSWKAGGTPSTIAAGSISTSPDVPSIASSVSANTESGFSIVSYTGDAGTGSTVGHGLNQAPKIIIVKPRNGTTTYGWRVYTEMTGNTKYLQLNGTDGAITFTDWNNTSPTSSVFTVNSSSPQTVNESGTDYIAYCFHSVDGFSKIDSYTGNGSPDGPFVYLGFRPKFWMMKSADDATHWVIYDSERETYNDVQDQLLPNEANGEAASGRPVDFLSNGVKLRFNSYLNDSTQTYIYMAFAENPFKYSNAR